ncbi:DMT family transporter [Cupriavidus sp. YAF13]|uniref:DMT family transporter n=1 Tax=Cupriavidus sp. YAF13 TaxID=3233075 RepID=UPI003F92EE12
MNGEAAALLQGVPEAATTIAATQKSTAELNDADVSGTPRVRAWLPMALAVCALLIWSTLAVSVVSLSGLSPLLTTGVALAGGGIIGLPWVAWRRLEPGAVLVGSLAMLGYHALYFLSLKTADAVAANLLHYLWPLFIILLTPLMLQGYKLTRSHVGAGVLGFAGAAACLGAVPVFGAGAGVGFALALVSALIWAYYSVWSRRFAEVPTATVSLYCLLAGLASLTAYAVLGQLPAYDKLALGGGMPSLAPRHWLTLAYLSLGPLGGAFYLWDYAMKKGNPHQVALLAYAVPVVSTLFVSLFLGRGIDVATMIGAVLVTVAVGIGNRASPRR